MFGADKGQAERLDGNLAIATIAARNLADLVSHAGLDPAQLDAALRSVVGATPGVSGGLLALEPGAPGSAGFARYFGSDGRRRDFVADGYDYRAQPWYRRTLASKKSMAALFSTTVPMRTWGPAPAADEAGVDDAGGDCGPRSAARSSSAGSTFSVPARVRRMDT